MMDEKHIDRKWRTFIYHIQEGFIKMVGLSVKKVVADCRVRCIFEDSFHGYIFQYDKSFVF